MYASIVFLIITALTRTMKTLSLTIPPMVYYGEYLLTSQEMEYTSW